MTNSTLNTYISKIINVTKSGNIIDFLLLVVALIALSFTAIFIKFSVSEIRACHQLELENK